MRNEKRTNNHPINNLSGCNLNKCDRINVYKWYFIQHAGDQCALGQCLKILKTNHNASLQHLKPISAL